MSKPDPHPSNPRWACRECNSTNVQVSFPTWFYEDRDGNLFFVEPDAEAEIRWHYCEDCGESFDGEPKDLGLTPKTGRPEPIGANEENGPNTSFM